MLKTIFAASFIAFVPMSYAQDASDVVGTWKLVSYEVEDQKTGKVVNPMGENPTGYVILTPEERISFVLTAEGRKPAETAEEKAKLLDTIIAYSGTYRIEDNKFITSVQVAWNPKWVGTEQAREFKIDDDTLQVLTPWRIMPNWPDAMTRSIVTFERSE